MKDKFFAVIDTNVIVSALISKYIDSNPGKVFHDQNFIFHQIL